MFGWRDHRGWDGTTPLLVLFGSGATEDGTVPPANIHVDSRSAPSLQIEGTDLVPHPRRCFCLPRGRWERATEGEVKHNAAESQRAGSSSWRIQTRQKRNVAAGSRRGGELTPTSMRARPTAHGPPRRARALPAWRRSDLFSQIWTKWKREETTGSNIR